MLIQRCESETRTSRKAATTSWHPFFGCTKSVTDRRSVLSALLCFELVSVPMFLKCDHFSL